MVADVADPDFWRCEQKIGRSAGGVGANIKRTTGTAAVGADISVWKPEICVEYLRDYYVNLLQRGGRGDSLNIRALLIPDNGYAASSQRAKPRSRARLFAPYFQNANAGAFALAGNNKQEPTLNYRLALGSTPKRHYYNIQARANQQKSI